MKNLKLMKYVFVSLFICFYQTTYGEDHRFPVKRSMAGFKDQFKEKINQVRKALDKISIPAPSTSAPPAPQGEPSVSALGPQPVNVKVAEDPTYKISDKDFGAPITQDLAENCADVEDIEKLVGPVRNQRDMGWCFANSSADILTALLSKGSPIMNLSEQVSSSFVAVNMRLSQAKAEAKNKDESNPIKKISILEEPGGSISGALAQSLTHTSFCNQLIDDNLLKANDGEGIMEKLQKFEKIWHLFKRLNEKDPSENKESKKKRIVKITQKYYKDSLLIQNEDSLIKILDKPSLGDSIEELIQEFCSPDTNRIEWVLNFKNSDLVVKDIFKIHNTESKIDQFFSTAFSILDSVKANFYSIFENPFNRTYFDINKVQLTQLIDKVLDRKELRTPVAISANMDHQIVSEEYKELFKNKTVGLHAMSITKRKFEGGVCKYFVRNSWGSRCYQYKTDGVSTFDIYSNSVACDEAQGGFWISREHLNRALHEVVYVEKK